MKMGNFTSKLIICLRFYIHFCVVSMDEDLLHLSVNIYLILQILQRFKQFVLFLKLKIHLNILFVVNNNNKVFRVETN